MHRHVRELPALAGAAIMSEPPCIFALNSTRALGERISQQLGIALCPHEEHEFEDGEQKCRALTSVRGRDVFVVQSLYSDARQSVHDKLCRLLFFVSSLKDAAAHRVTALVPYLCYAREDRKTHPRDPLTGRYVGQLLEAAGVDHMVALDVHNPAAFQNAFRCPTDHLEAGGLFVAHFVPLLATDDVVVVSTDIGGIKRAEQFGRLLSEALGRRAASAFLAKERADGLVSGHRLVGEVKGRTVVVVDDLISTGATLAHAVETLHDAGAGRIFAAASHALFTSKANDVLADPALRQILATDSVVTSHLTDPRVKDKLVTTTIAGLLADAISAIHGHHSMSAPVDRCPPG